MAIARHHTTELLLALNPQDSNSHEVMHTWHAQVQAKKGRDMAGEASAPSAGFQQAHLPPSLAAPCLAS